MTLSDAGREQDALAVAEEAVAVRRELAAVDMPAHEAELASALNNLGNRLSAAGRLGEGIAAGLQAVEIRRRLARARPRAHAADLATSLSNVGIDLSLTGRHDDAVDFTAEALDILRPLARDDPGSFGPELARVLLAYARTRVAARVELTEALAAAEEAAAAYSGLAHENPEFFAQQLRAAARMRVAASMAGAFPADPSVEQRGNG